MVETVKAWNDEHYVVRRDEAVEDTWKGAKQFSLGPVRSEQTVKYANVHVPKRYNGLSESEIERTNERHHGYFVHCHMLGFDFGLAPEVRISSEAAQSHGTAIKDSANS